jgi:hypothetical protein
MLESIITPCEPCPSFDPSTYWMVTGPLRCIQNLKIAGMPFREDKYGPPSDVDERGKEDIRESWMGVCQLHATGYFRRIDIKVYSPVQYPFALLAFTGNAHFNRSLRFWAKKIGYSLSDHGIKVRPKAEPVRQKCALTTPLPLPDVCYTEADVLNRFGIEFIAPERRH